MRQKLNEQYKELCAQLGDVEYKLQIYSDKKRQLMADIQLLDKLAGEAPAVEALSGKEKAKN